MLSTSISAASSPDLAANMLKPCVHKGVPQIPFSNIGSRPVPRPNPGSVRFGPQRLACGSNLSTAQTRGNLCCCSAASAAMEITSVSGRMAELKEQGRGAFIPFIVAGDPNLDATEKAILALDRAGADIIELGVPYSDPLADGPTIQAAATRALAAGCTLNKVIDVVRRVSPQIRASIVMFTYFNPIMRRGAEQFCRDIKKAGASGLLVPDIPLEETGPVREVATAAGLELVLLTTPTTPIERMEAIAKVSQGFVYLVSVTGVTGLRTSNELRVEGLIEKLHSITDKAVAVGFGVSGPEQAKQIMQWGAEGVIVGSALVKALGDASSPEEGLQAMEKLAMSIREAI